MPIKIFSSPDQNYNMSATEMNRYFLQQHSVVKPSDQSVTNSTSLQPDNHLFAPVFANTDYWVWCLIFYTGPATDGDLKLNWDGPSGATFTWLSDGLASGATSTVSTVSRNQQTIGSTPAPGTTGGNAVAPVKGILRTSATAGTFQLTWAQLTASLTACTIFSGSTLIIRRLTT